MRGDRRKAHEHSGHRRGRLHRVGGLPASLQPIPATASSTSTSSPMPATSTRCARSRTIPTISFVKADICDAAAMSPTCCAEHEIDVVMHLAAESHVDRSIDGPAAFIETNIVGTFRLLKAALAYWRSLLGRHAGRVPLPPCLDRRGVRRSALRRAAFSPRTRPTRRPRPIRHRRRRPTIWCAPGTRPTACRSCSPTARTITGRSIFPKS